MNETFGAKPLTKAVVIKTNQLDLGSPSSFLVAFDPCLIRDPTTTTIMESRNVGVELRLLGRPQPCCRFGELCQALLVNEARGTIATRPVKVSDPQDLKRRLIGNILLEVKPALSVSVGTSSDLPLQTAVDLGLLERLVYRAQKADGVGMSADTVHVNLLSLVLVFRLGKTGKKKEAPTMSSMTRDTRFDPNLSTGVRGEGDS
jgi:hypothetical protein